jgi:hypothetical protein
MISRHHSNDHLSIDLGGGGGHLEDVTEELGQGLEVWMILKG